MFKRANKITALLVAAASVMSVVPAMASDYTKVDSQDGIVYGAVAYKDGAALIDGEVDGNDAAYYLADGKYNELSDVDSGSDYSAYGSKYAKVNEDGDYFVDLTNGDVTDESVDENDADDAASALRKKAKEVDRYGNDDLMATLTEIAGNKFGESWYEADQTATDHYTITGYAGNGSNEVVGAGDVTPTIYTDNCGNYIDADYSLGKIKVETTHANATIENTVDNEDLVDGAITKTYAQVAATKTLGQDADYIYRYAEITVTVVGGVDQETVKINNKNFKLNASKQVMLPVIQKISKAQASDDIEEAKYAKTVYNYVISDDSAALDGTNAGFLATADAARVICGKLVAYKVVDAASNGSNDTVEVQAMTLKQKNGYYYTDLEDRASITPEYSSDLGKTAFDTDVDGNIYVLDGGYIKEFDGTDDWNKVYKVDGSFDSLSVYDKDNMVSWSQADEIYSVIGGKTTTDEDTTTTTPVVTAGWAQAADGTWTYNKADGTKATGWLLDGATWYYLKADGVMATGWVNDGGTWYYLAGSGAMKTGWVNDNGTWYYLAGSGAMLANTTVDGYVLGANGAWVK